MSDDRIALAAERRRLDEHLRVVLERAGIGAEVERLSRHAGPDYSTDRNFAPFDTAKGRQQHESARRERSAMFRDGYRRLVFGVPDETHRREIMAADAAIHAHMLKEALAELDDARRRASAGPQESRSAGIAIGVFAAGGTWLAWSQGGPMLGTVAGVFLLGLILGDLPRRIGRDAAARAQLQAEADAARRHVDEMVEGQTFDAYEQQTGRKWKSEASVDATR